MNSATQNDAKPTTDYDLEPASVSDPKPTTGSDIKSATLMSNNVKLL